MKNAIDETNRRRQIQEAYNKKHNISPKGVKKAIREGIESYRQAKNIIKEAVKETDEQYDIASVISELERDMEEAARNLQFERAIVLRDQINELRKKTVRKEKNERR